LREVRVDIDGGGDVRSLAEGLRLVRDGGTVVVMPGRYRAEAAITKSVRIVGDRELQPLIEGYIVSTGEDVTIEGVKIEGSHQDGTLIIMGGSLRLVDCFIKNSGGVAHDNQMTAAVYVTGGHLDIDRAVIGPGRDAAIVVGGSGTLHARRTNLYGGTGYGIYSVGSSIVDISDSWISGRSAARIAIQSELSLSDTTLIGTYGRPVIMLEGQAPVTIVRNEVALAGEGKLTIPADRNWLHIGPRVPRAVLKIGGNTTSGGKRLPGQKSEN
jgi:hypothetical protein